MSTPHSPFQRLLQQTSEVANQDPRAAFAELDSLFGKSSSADEVQQLCAFAANLGGAVLGNFEETQELLDRMLAHPGLEDPDASGVRRSILRAKAVLFDVAGESEQAEALREQGVTNASEQCRLSIMTAQTFAARQLPQKAVAHLKKCAALCQELAADDPIVGQVTTIAVNLVRVAEQQTNRAHDLLLAASSAAMESLQRAEGWQNQHMAYFQRARAQLHVGNPTAALVAVQRMMALEQEHEADSFFCFQSAQLACRAQLIRGQVKVAKGALQACRDLAAGVQNPDWKRQCGPALKELEQSYATMTERSGQL
jgi:hypothetical protein